MGCRLLVIVVCVSFMKLVVSGRCVTYDVQDDSLWFVKANKEVGAPCDCSTGSLDCSSRNRTTFGTKDRCSDKVSVANISYNRIEELPRTAFSKMFKLKMLLLNNNNLRHIPGGIFCFLTELQMINLDWNILMSLPQHIFSGLKKLKNISLKNNKLIIISPNIFSELPVLEKLDMENNFLKRISPAAFTSSKKLQIINLRNNTLNTLPVGLFQEESSLEVLDLSKNHLRAFASCHISGLRNISVLNLSGNKLTSLPIFDDETNLYAALLWGNNIRTVKEHEIRSWLQDGKLTRFMTLKGSLFNETTLLKNLSSLKWMLEDSKLQVYTSDSNCECGSVKLGKVKFEFCVDIQCGAKQRFVSWKDAVRYAKCVEGIFNERYRQVCEAQIKNIR